MLLPFSLLKHTFLQFPCSAGLFVRFAQFSMWLVDEDMFVCLVWPCGYEGTVPNKYCNDIYFYLLYCYYTFTLKLKSILTISVSELINYIGGLKQAKKNQEGVF